MNYKIIRVFADECSALEPKVNEAIAEGWKPEGAPFNDLLSRCWCQAMTRATAPKPGETRLKEPKR